MPTPTDLFQDLVVAPCAEGFAVCGAVDGNCCAIHAEAADAIQAAIDALPGGGSVRLQAGAYPLARPIALQNHARLIGAGPATLLEVAGECGVLIERKKAAVVAELRLRAADEKAQAGIVLGAAGDCRVREVTCERFAAAGIHVKDSSFLCRISGCSLAGNRYGIHLDHLREGRAGDYVPNVVSDCVIYGGHTGIVCESAIVVNITGCAVYHAVRGYHLHTDANSVSIVGCRTFQLSGEAVLVDRAHEFNCCGNIFCWHTGPGIVVKDAWWGTIVGNNVIDNGSYNTGAKNFTVKQADVTDTMPLCDAIVLKNTRGYTVTGNALFNWSVAPPMNAPVHETDDCSDNLISANNANYYAAAKPVLSAGKRSVELGNVGWPNGAYNTGGDIPAEEWLQTFRRELTEKFIDNELE